MKKILTILALMFFTNTTQTNAMGLFYTDATYPVTATGNTIKDLSTLKKSSASTNNILWFVEIGDASIDTAGKNGDIKIKKIFIRSY